jgi:hypothetical protein
MSADLQPFGKTLQKSWRAWIAFIEAAEIVTHNHDAANRKGGPVRVCWMISPKAITSGEESLAA